MGNGGRRLRHLASVPHPLPTSPLDRAWSRRCDHPSGAELATTAINDFVCIRIALTIPAIAAASMPGEKNRSWRAARPYSTHISRQNLPGSKKFGAEIFGRLCLFEALFGVVGSVSCP